MRGVRERRRKDGPAAANTFGGVPAATPLVTYVLIAINVVMFVLQNHVGGSAERARVDLACGGRRRWYRLLTSAFLHMGLTHILFNMWALYVVGPPLETALGRLRFSSLYVISALGGSVLVYLLTSTRRPRAHPVRCSACSVRCSWWASG